MTDKKSIPSLASLRQNASQKNNNLTQLKEKMQSKTPSLASLASSSTKKPITSLQSLATRSLHSSTPSLSSLAAKKASTTSTPKLTSLSHLASKQTIVKTKQSIPAPIKSHEITKEKKEEEEEEEEEVDPLVGNPSAVAQFLFKPEEIHVINAQSIFQQATQKPTSIPIFKFDQPSPDDIVFAAQSQRSQKKSAN